MRNTSKHILILFVIFVVGCGPKKGIVTKKSQEKNKTEEVVSSTTEEETSNSNNTTKPPTTVESYIERYADIAQSEMRKSKIPASITLAQGILESGSGKGRLAVKANNHFGIKCHGWKGAKIYHDDDRSQECFRKYKRAESSYEDHSEFLTSRKRYAFLFNLDQDDYKGWARGLKKAGYATDRQYPQKLIILIERYKLYVYDALVLGNHSNAKVRVDQGIMRYIVEKGDTLYSLAKRYNTTVDAIKDLNNLNSNDLAIGQEIMIPN
jgi:flagellum-specific peptidoglycan hydrolase FlgJ